MRPVTDEERAEVRRLHAEGASMGAIATALDRAKSTIQHIANDLNLTFDRSQTEAATAAKVQDNRARRAAIIEWQYQRCMTLAERLDAETFQTAGNSQDGPVMAEFPFVPPQDELHLSRAIASYAKVAADLEKVDAGQDVAEDRSMLGDLMARLRGVNRPE